MIIMNNKNKSFTLIELLVVIVIIGILAGVIMISTSSSIDKANFAKAQAFSSTVQNELLSNLVSEWTFDEGTNQTINRTATNDDVKDTWGSNNGTVNGNPQIKGGTDCVSGRCLEFDGSGDYIRITYNDILNITTKGSIFIWVKGNSQSNRGIFAHYDMAASQRSWLMRADDLNFSMYLSNNGSSYSTRTVIDKKVFDNNWHLIGFTFNAGILKMYIDGIMSNYTENGTLGSSLFKSLSDITIGCRLDNNSLNSPFTGRVDEGRIYNAALSSSQVKQNYIAGLNSMLANGNISKEDYNERINVLAYDNK